MTTRLLRVTVGCVLATACVFAQAAKPAFEVATIKRNAQLDRNGTYRMFPGGVFRSPVDVVVIDHVERPTEN